MPKKRGRNKPLVRIARGLYRYGPTGNIYWCRKSNGKNVWRNLQTNDRLRAMAITALELLQGGQNGHTKITILSSREILASETTPALWPSPISPSSSEAKFTNPLSPAPLSQTGSPSAEQQDVVPPKSITLNELVEQYKRQWNHLAEGTRIKMDCHFKVAARYLSFDRAVGSIRLADLRELKSRLREKNGPSSVNDILFKGLGALFKLAVDDEYITKSPLEKLPRARRGEIERRQPSWDEAQRIIREVDRKSHESGLIVGLMLNFGVGQAEVAFLRGDRIDPSNRVIHFRRKKTGKEFDVPISSNAEALIDTLKAEGRLKRDKQVVVWRNPRKALAAACERLGLPAYEPRSLRRCFIVHALELGIDPRVVARWQGHKDATLIFRVYGRHIDAQHDQQQAQKLTNPSPKPSDRASENSTEG